MRNSTRNAQRRAEREIFTAVSSGDRQRCWLPLAWLQSGLGNVSSERSRQAGIRTPTTLSDDVQKLSRMVFYETTPRNEALGRNAQTIPVANRTAAVFTLSLPPNA